MTEELKDKKVVLIDGSGYIFRAFYALPSMTRSDGTPVNAVYGFCAMLMKLLKEMPADYIAVVFDAARKTFRQDIYPEYKANRRETPEELIPQFPLFRQAVEAFNLAQVEMEGYEADDLLATYSRLAQQEKAQVTIISADKDLMQMVCSGITLFDPMKQRVIDKEQVFEKFGVTPDKVIDVQALAGDTSDNIPGVAGIGIKTAAQLVNEFGSLEDILENASSIKQQKRRETLIEHAQLARISKKLVTLDNHVPIEKSLSSFKVKAPEPEALSAFLSEMHFKSLLTKLPEWLNKPIVAPKQQAQTGTTVIAVTTKPATPPPVKQEYILIQSEKELQKYIDAAISNGIVAIDTETDSLNAMQANMVGFSFCYEEGKAFYVPIRHVAKEAQNDLFGDSKDAIAPEQIPVAKALGILKPLLENKGVLKVGHNIKYDWHIFANEYGDSLDITPIEDTMVLSYDLDGASHGHGMDELAELFLNHQTVPYDEITGKGKTKITFDKVPLDEACRYAAEDADITLRLYHYLKQRLYNEKLVNLYETFDRPTVAVLYQMERNGIKVSEDELKRLSGFFGERLTTLEQNVFTAAGEEFNVNSPGQLGTILFEKMQLSGGKKSSKTGAWGTDAAVLEELAAEGHQIAQDMLQYRLFSKLKSTYTDALQAQINPKTGRVHTNFMQTVTSTGRLSSNDPNLQNIPIRSEEGREIRKAFIADKGKKLLSADYSQIELRLMAHVANVEGLKEAFAQGIDIHAATASQIFDVPVEGMDPMVRRSAKAINFGIIYGISAFGLSNQLNIPIKEAQDYINAYFARYPEIRTYMEETVHFARENGFVMTPFGRKCSVGSMKDGNASRRQFAERSAINAPIQGGAADILKKAMVRLPDALKQAELSAKLLLQVHDELVLEVPDSETEKTKTVIKDVMENVFTLSVPLVADVGIGLNWADAH